MNVEKYFSWRAGDTLFKVEQLTSLNWGSDAVIFSKINNENK